MYIIISEISKFNKKKEKSELCISSKKKTKTCVCLV